MNITRSIQANKTLIYQPQRTIIWGKRMLNKPNKREPLQTHNYDEVDYLKAMKKF